MAVIRYEGLQRDHCVTLDERDAEFTTWSAFVQRVHKYLAKHSPLSDKEVELLDWNVPRVWYRSALRDLRDRKLAYYNGDCCWWVAL
jgi:hypothetical protein